MGYFIPVHEHPNYVVSNDGEVVSIRNEWFKTLKPGSRKTGHLHVRLGSPDKKIRTRMVHWIVLASFVGPRPTGMVCRHLNGNPKDNRLTNLVWGTPQENSDDRTLHGNNITGDHRGTLNGRAKINEGIVREIRSSELSGAALGRKYGVTRHLVNMIRRGEAWGHVC